MRARMKGRGASITLGGSDPPFVTICLLPDVVEIGFSRPAAEFAPFGGPIRMLGAHSLLAETAYTHVELPAVFPESA